MDAPSLIELLLSDSYALPAREGKWIERGGSTIPFNSCSMAADEIEALRARVEELEAALTRIRTEDLSRFDCTLVAAKAQGLI